MTTGILADITEWGRGGCSLVKNQDEDASVFVFKHLPQSVPCFNSPVCSFSVKGTLHEKIQIIEKVQ